MGVVKKKKNKHGVEIKLPCNISKLDQAEYCDINYGQYT